MVISDSFVTQSSSLKYSVKPTRGELYVIRIYATNSCSCLTEGIQEMIQWTQSENLLKLVGRYALSSIFL